MKELKPEIDGLGSFASYNRQYLIIVLKFVIVMEEN